MVNKRLLSLCDDSKKWIAMTVLMNWISIICNIAIVVYIGNVIDNLENQHRYLLCLQMKMEYLYLE